MKKSFISILLLASLIAGARAEGIKWTKAFDRAKAEARSSGKLIMIDFYTSWCGWCKKLDADTYPAPQVVKESSKFVTIKLDAEKDAEGVRLAKKFGVNGYPTILFLDANENLNYKVVGYEPAKEFAVSMKKAASIPIDKAKYAKVLKKDPNNSSALLGMAGVTAAVGDSAKAAKYLNKAAGHVPASKRGKLLDAYNAVGDAFQNEGKYDQAISYFRKAIDSRFVHQSVYANMSIGACYEQNNQPKKAIPYLEAVVKAGSAAGEYLSPAKQQLEALKKLP